MLRKVLLAGAAVAALAVPLVTTSTAQAGSFGFDISVHRGRSYHGGYQGYHGGHYGGYHRRHHCHYHVFYRDCSCDPWRCYGHYDCSPDAYRVADYLRYRGYHVRVGHD